ncbi:anti-anti-sigma factor [Saccharopolyspora erythraea NRRL 2338]|uniref:Uncharacterized protein n=2 Tax=Saccharopolyspora erythraea TaxID=1836 RepID=A4FJM6_SACEN|nr:STAS domain-containing protein [Saccharopolyspora erythraea]EQD82652.1 hypothetical protein N599_29435 [Saccharopolyspora erythraea D]PFG97898.1 anti-anti-sigma factor [Saccharopolyspora erythraea NRRL 2338]QRK88035.1 STAS domain-containing protein [Saccharopolyspora erythraea]CAM04251.1 hypothetical protein SACE_4987 [Saccharopolyspora erythraea NRRL 2338]
MTTSPEQAGDIDTLDVAERAGRLSLHVDHYRPHTVVLTARGQLDATNVARFAEVLRSRLLTAIRAIVVDLQGLTFLGIPGLDVLGQAHLHASTHGQRLYLVADHPEVLRALRVAGLAHLAQHSSVETALDDAPDPARGGSHD